MTTPRPLRDLFAELVGSGPSGTGPAARLHDGGHTDLPPDLLAEAVVAYADAAPVEVAEHLATFVTAHTARALDAATGTEADPAHALELLATSPLPGHATLGTEEALDIDFGAGAGTVAPDRVDPGRDAGSIDPGQDPDSIAPDPGVMPTLDPTAPDVPPWDDPPHPDPGPAAPRGDDPDAAPDDGIDA